MRFGMGVWIRAPDLMVDIGELDGLLERKMTVIHDVG
jgi:hypothetical protein